jgi:cellulose synthase/poly-beta-1,6-N-acetylglucosamine synthase-like glycosyltransferase
MGISSSVAGDGHQKDGEHFAQIVSSNSKSRNITSEEESSTHICYRARVLKQLDFSDLYEAFLSSPNLYTSFALTQQETEALLFKSIMNMDQQDYKSISPPLAEEVVRKDVHNYVELVMEMSERQSGAADYVDFMAVVSSVLLLKEDVSIEEKVDQLYAFIVVCDPKEPEQFMTFEQFLVSMSSFERGVSHAMGKPACSEHYIRDVALQWMALADPQHRGNVQYTNDPNLTVENINFFNFCTNRQHVVRRILESLSKAEVEDDSEGAAVTIESFAITRKEKDQSEGSDLDSPLVSRSTFLTPV